MMAALMSDELRGPLIPSPANIICRLTSAGVEVKRSPIGTSLMSGTSLRDVWALLADITARFG